MPKVFEQNARQIERRFIRKLTKQGKVLTANGKASIYLRHDNLVIYLKSTKSDKGYKIVRMKLRSAISFTCYRRTVSRKDLEPYSRFSSVLLGIIIEVFENKAKVLKTPTGLLRLTLIGIRYFFAGGERSVRDLKIAAAAGAKFILFSYYYLRNKKSWKDLVLKLGFKVLLDSGEFTRWQADKKGKTCKPIRVEEYADFIEKHQDVLYAWFNLDRVGDAATSKANAEYLKSRGLAPIEIWHVESDIKELDALVAEDHAIIAIGGHVGMSEKARRRYFQRAFERYPGQNYHFMGGSSKLLREFPWFTADSKGWIISRIYGEIINRNGQRAKPKGWSPLKCLAYTVSEMVGLEDIFKDVLPIKPEHEQLSLNLIAAV